jgi:hypothetical protein
MTEVPLICHAQSLADGIESIGVTITRGTSGEITLIYRVSGETDALEIPARSKPDRIDNLWKTTCFELFTGRFEDENYLEYNFSPSDDLATNAPDIKFEQSKDALTLIVTLVLPDAWREHDLCAGLSAVIATKSGNISYWAAAHPAGKPDFHHKDCFAVQLEARSAA